MVDSVTVLSKSVILAKDSIQSFCLLVMFVLSNVLCELTYIYRVDCLNVGMTVSTVVHFRLICESDCDSTLVGF